MKLAPIVLFTYNRPEHTRQTVKSLKNNHLASQSSLFIFSDGPKDEKNNKKVNEVRHYLKTIKSFKTIRIIERRNNWGLSENIIDGVTNIVNEYGKVIVLEDDLVTSPYFIKFMNEALEYYERNECVISIHGYTYPIRELLPETFFIRGADCWGWATWQRGWALFEADGKKLLDELQQRKLNKIFDFNGLFSYTTMLKKQIAGKNDSWAVRWYASAFLKNKLTLYPGCTLVHNIGMDFSGTHCGKSDSFGNEVAASPILIKNIPIEENVIARSKIEHFLKSIKNISIFSRIKRQLKSL